MWDDFLFDAITCVEGGNFLETTKAERASSKRRTSIWPKTAKALASTNVKAEGPQRQQLVSRLSQMTGYPRSACRQPAALPGATIMRNLR
jgi:hypothetical protein